MFFLQAFFMRIYNDLKQKNLMPLKLLFFVHSSTLFVLYPYLTIHMRELGINVEETAIMSAVTPVVAIVMPPLAGMVADRIGNFRILLAIFSALGGGASLLLLLVPVGRVVVTYPETVVLNMGCGHGGYFELGVNTDQNCHFHKALQMGQLKQIEMSLESCGFQCHADIGGQVTPMLPQAYEEQELRELIPRTHEYEVLISNNITHTFAYTQNPEDIAIQDLNDPGEDLREHRHRKNNDLYKTSIRMLKNSTYFFPTSGLYNLSCIPVNDKINQTYRCKFGSNVYLEDDVLTATAPRMKFKTDVFLGINKRKFLVSSLTNWMNSSERHNATCEDIYTQNGQKISISVPLNGRIVQLSSCSPRCLITAPRKEVCSNTKAEKVYDINVTFWSYLVIRVFIGIIGGTAFAMFEGAVIAILREQNADYGLQRIYATVGGMISSPLSGLLIQYASKGKGYTDFRPAFYLYAGLKLASGFLMLLINLEFKAPAHNVVSDVMSVLKNIELVALFVIMFIMGTAWGYIESFLFWLLQDLGGTSTLMGMTITVGGIFGIPLLALSGPIIDRIGHANVLFIGFIFYAIRLLGYSLIYNPWLCLIFEAMESVTSALSFTAAVTYAAKLSTTTTDTSIQGLLGGIYFGVGKGAGSLFGGYMMKAFGTRETYRIFSVICVITGIAYFFFNKFYLRKRPQTEGNDIVKKKPKTVDMVEIDLTGCQKKEKELSNGIANNCKDVEAQNNKKNAEQLHSRNDIQDEIKSTDTNANNDTKCSDNLGYVGTDEGHEATETEKDCKAKSKVQTEEKDIDTTENKNENNTKDSEENKTVKNSVSD